MRKKKLSFSHISNILKPICPENQIIYLALFGSYSRAEEKKQSDVDLLVEFCDEKSLIDLVRIEERLSKKLGKKVDLVTKKSLSPYLKKYILPELKTIYKYEK